MIHVIRKAFFDFEKEEKFLNAMSSKGFALKNYSWCKYVFEDAPKGEYIYRLELLENPIEHPENGYVSYIQIIYTHEKIQSSYNDKKKSNPIIKIG